MSYASLTRSEHSSFIEKHKLTLLNIKCCPTRPDEAVIAVAQKDIDDMLVALSLATTTTSSPTHTNTLHQRVMRQQSLRDDMTDIKSFNPGNDVHHFITNLNQAYTINIKPYLAKCAKIKEEIIFPQMVDSQQDIFGFEQLKSYLTATRCPTSNISVKPRICKDETARG